MKIFWTNRRDTHNGTGLQLIVIFVGIILASMLLGGCSHFNGGLQAKETFTAANDLFRQGNYVGSLGKYQLLLEQYPSAGDRVLFEMGIIHAYPGNEQKDYQQALARFQKLINDYPESSYRKDSEVMTFNIHNVVIKDKTIATQQNQIELLRQELTNKGAELLSLQNKAVTLKNTIDALNQDLKYKEGEISKLKKEAVVFLNGTADKILIEKKERRLTLLSKGKVLKTYPIALGGNPIGPKERQGDNKTPEGNYVIDARNKYSRFHLSLHISYPNEKDKKRARALGVAPGGDIMIHGIKNGLGWAGEKHAEIDWTQGCIAVTDEEIEEIEKVVPNGTAVEIRP